jgi:hypothetical protein
MTLLLIILFPCTVHIILFRFICECCYCCYCCYYYYYYYYYTWYPYCRLLEILEGKTDYRR